MNQILKIAAAAALLFASAGTAFAEYPERPITLIAPGSAGGGADRAIFA